MPPITYLGKISPAIFLFFKGDSVSGSKATSTTKDYIYPIQNESLKEFTIKGTVGGRTYKLKRKATKKKRYFDATLGTYTLPPIKASVLNALLDTSATPTWKIDIKFEYKTFIYHMLTNMTTTESTLYNLAKPKSKKKILNALKYSRSGKKISVKYKTEPEHWKDIPLKYVDKEINPVVSGPPEIKIIFLMDFLTGINDAKRQVMRKLIAMEWSKLLKYGRNKHSDMPDFAKLWWKNVFYYLINHTNFSRGEKIKKKLFDGSKNKSQKDISKILRKDIDQWLITANHWGQRRESWSKEKYQNILSDAFGAIHKKRWLASPVAFNRAIEGELSLNSEDSTSMTLQYGTGHCGEHANTSYIILTDIVKNSGSSVKHVAYTGNSNIDHAFVIFGLDIKKVIKTKVQSNKNTRYRKPDPSDPTGRKKIADIGKEIYVWNLRQTIIDNPGRQGYVMDPYLDPSAMPPTANRLLNVLNSKKKKNQKKDTDFLAFVEEHPLSCTLDNKPSVKNV